MNEKAQLNAMAEKYKAEMMRLYNKSAPSVTARSAPQSKGTKPPEHIPPKMNTPEQKAEPKPRIAMPEPTSPNDEAPPKKDGQHNSAQQEAKPKFPPPSDIFLAEGGKPETVPAIAAVPVRSENAAGVPHPHGGNYGFSTEQPQSDETPYPYGQIPTEQPESTLEPLYTDSAPELTTSSGYLQAEVTAASRAVPIKDATVIVTRKNGDKSELVTLLVTDESGHTDTVELPTPDISYSESPDQTQKPYSDYQLSVYSRGFYTIPQLNVPIFPTVKSIQPVSMVPLAQFAQEGSMSPDNIQQR